ncbi:hypothetical protein [Halorhabdus sp. CUG00001]|uniref:hypothetical protein n=1 Tax=Halorhabdus sp. CUG00001 TaxID=2600297 RepID=UPI00131C1028|nr:hypothetical protein [Halorhabdus sp. CUG00001]
MSTTTPTAVQDFQTQTPSLEPDLEDKDDPNAAGEWETLDYPDPITHGIGVELVINDLDDDDRDEFAYRRLWRAWRDAVGDPSNEPYVLIEDVHERLSWLDDDFPAHLVLKSKGWKVGTDAGEDGVEGQRYEYSLQVERYDPEIDADDPEEAIERSRDNLRAPVSYQCWIQPQNEDLVYQSGDNLICQYGEGTKFRTQTTYAEAGEAIARTIAVVSLAFDALEIDRPAWETMNRESWRLWKGEVHHRIPKTMMSAVVAKLRSMRTLIEFGGSGDAEGGGRYRNGANVEERVVSDMWNRIGFAGYADRDGFQLGQKVYRITGNPRDSRLKEPKLEAFFAGTDDDTRLPHVDDWGMLRGTLRQLVSATAIRSGIEHYSLQEDDYYKPDEREMIDTIVPKGWRRAMREANEEREESILRVCYSSLTKARWDILYLVAALDGAKYDQLVELSGFSRDYVREIVAEFEEEDVLRRTTYPRLVVFHNEELRLNSIERLEEIHPDRSLDDVRADAEDRVERRREQREQREEADDQNDEADDAGDDQEDVDDDRPEWVLVEDLRYSAADIGRYLESGEIEPDDAKIRASAYNWLG